MRSPGLACSRQQGMALVITLVFILILTILGLSALQGGMMQGRMASNQQDYDLAFQAAEAALHEGEKRLLDTDPGSLSTLLADTTDCQCAPDRTHDLDHHDLSANPRFCVDEIGVVDHSVDPDGSSVERLYCIRAAGFGASDNSRVMLESRFVKVEE